MKGATGMVTASRILGDQVGSTAPAFLAILAVHVLAGLTAVLTGAIAALARKGSPQHIRAGRWFYRAITVVFATAAALSALRWRQDYDLFIIGVGVPQRRGRGQGRRPGDRGATGGSAVRRCSGDRGRPGRPGGTCRAPVRQDRQDSVWVAAPGHAPAYLAARMDRPDRGCGGSDAGLRLGASPRQTVTARTGRYAAPGSIACGSCAAGRIRADFVSSL